MYFRLSVVFILIIILMNNKVWGQPIIADHNAVSEFDQIPDYWINEVKKMMLNIPGESHGRGYMYGLELLEDLDSKYAVNITWTGEPESNTQTHLRGVRTYRSQYGSWTENGGEEDFYTSASVVTRMQDHLDYMRTTLNNPVSVFMFGWCWDMTWHNSPGGQMDPEYYVHWAGSSVGGPQGDRIWGLDSDDYSLTDNSVSMQTYIDAVVSYNSHDPLTVTAFSTGPADNYTAHEAGYQRYIKHQYIRDYVNTHSGTVLFDYSDILSYNDDEEQYINQTGWTDFNNVHHTYPSIHPDNDAEYDGGTGSCHISETGCIRIGKAMWWMLARIAGWQTSVSTEPPVISDIPNQMISEGNNFTSINLDTYVNDADNQDSEIYWYTSTTTNIIVNITNRIASITANDPDWNGNETITFTARDPGGLTDSDDAMFIVTPVNDPPDVINIPDQSIAVGGSFTTINLDNYVSDPDNSDSEINWTASPTSHITVTIANRVATITANDSEWSGTETVTFTAQDPSGLTDTDSVIFTVTPASVIPEIPNNIQIQNIQ